MATERQTLGEFGEKCIVQRCSCPRCKRSNTLKRLPANFKCADVICDFCGYLAQIKSSTVANVAELPFKILGAAWAPQNERMQAGIYIRLFLVLVTAERKAHAIYDLAADLQRPEMFKPRKPFSSTAKRAGWIGFLYDLRDARTSFIRLPT